MARIDNNLLVKGARGNLGKQYVYKKRGKETHIARMPIVNKKAVVSEKQEEIRDQFGSASAYAQAAMSDPDLKKTYDKRAKDGQTGANLAFRDFLKAPVVKAVDTAGYNGNPGSIIVVKAKDDFRVASLKLAIRKADGTLVEEGNAVLNPLKRGRWIYTATLANDMLAGSIVTATAFDIPGNEGKLELTI